MSVQSVTPTLITTVATNEPSPRMIKSMSKEAYDIENKENSEIKWNRMIKSNENEHINQILPRLYLGDDLAARNISILRDKHITHVLNLTTNIPNKFEPEITYLKITIFDFESQNISQYFSEANEFISEALAKNENNAVLVHCNAGISRSASFVIAYLMKKCNYKTYREALAYVRKCRPVVSPNRGFEKQLLNLESQNRRKLNCVLM